MKEWMIGAGGDCMVWPGDKRRVWEGSMEGSDGER